VLCEINFLKFSDSLYFGFLLETSYLQILVLAFLVLLNFTVADMLWMENFANEICMLCKTRINKRFPVCAQLII